MQSTNSNSGIRFLVFKEEDTWFAVALELGIVVDGNDPDATYLSLLEAIDGVLEMESDPKYKEDTFITPEIDPEYEDMWQRAQAAKQKTLSPYNVYMSGLRHQVA